MPLENEDVNECWIADRDRFSYEALNSDQRITKPMLKQGGEWREVDWTTALEYVAQGLKCISKEQGANTIGALATEHSTVEELYLLAQLMRGLGSDNVDTRLRQADFATGVGARWLGLPIAELATLDRALVIGSFLRKDHPLFAARLRQATKRGAKISAIGGVNDDWLLPIANRVTVAPSAWVQALADAAAAVAAEKGVSAPVAGNATDAAKAIAASLLSGQRAARAAGQRNAGAIPASLVAAAGPGPVDRRARPAGQAGLLRWSRPTRSARNWWAPSRNKAASTLARCWQARVSRACCCWVSSPSSMPPTPLPPSPQCRAPKWWCRCRRSRPRRWTTPTASCRLPPLPKRSGTFVNAEGRRAELPRFGQAARRCPSGLEGAARAGHDAGCAWFRFRNLGKKSKPPPWAIWLRCPPS